MNKFNFKMNTDNLSNKRMQLIIDKRSYFKNDFVNKFWERLEKNIEGEGRTTNLCTINYII